MDGNLLTGATSQLPGRKPLTRTNLWKEIVTNHTSNDGFSLTNHNISEAFRGTDINHPSLMMHPHSLASVKWCGMPTLLQRSMQSPLQSPAYADTARATTHIYQSHRFHIVDDRFIISPPHVIHSQPRSLRLLLFDSRQSIVITFSWPAKSWCHRATLGLNQLFEQLSLLDPLWSSSVTQLGHTRRDLRVQSCTWLWVLVCS